MKSIKQVIVLTNSFPLGQSETFLEAETEVWAKNNEINLTFIPILDKSKSNRRIPDNWQVDSRLVTKLKFYEKYFFFIFPLIFINPFFWKEITQFPQVIFNPHKLRRLVAVSIFSHIISKFLIKHYGHILKKSNSLVYSYWFYYTAYGAALLKSKGFPFKLITRAHRMDVYQNREETHYYIPFRRFPVWDYFDMIYPVSKEGYDYLISNQNIPKEKLKVSYLGVAEQTHINNSTGHDTLHLISCSNLLPVKKINLLIDNLGMFGLKHPEIQIKWTHLGDGILWETLTSYAKEKLSSENIQHAFLGNIDNAQVLDYYKNNAVDCFVTTSASEGLPVSIMEALSFGIPVISTNVGGISEAVNDKVGYLLTQNFTYDDFEKGLLYIFSFKNRNKRKQISTWGNDQFGATRNYGNFIEDILK